MTSGETTHSRTQNRRRVWVVLLISCLALLVAQRLIYHHAYLHFDPFAHATFSDGQVYEEAARDILAHPPLGSQPFFLQGAYAYWLAWGLSLRGVLSDALLLQLVLAALACGFVYATARRFHELQDALVSLGLWLSYAGLAFYENKYLSAELGVAANAAQLACFARVSHTRSRSSAALLGATSGLSVLARPNLVVALPFAVFGLWHCAPTRRQALQLCAAGCAGLLLALAPMAARNLAVTGSASVFPSHGGGIPFYIGNHPGATGLWNDAGGLLSGQVLLERSELADRLRLPEAAGEPGAIDKRIGDALYARALAFMRAQPLAWLRIEAKKLWYALGNDDVTHDYDVLGERELLGDLLPLRLPFGILLGLGALGLIALGRGTRQHQLLAVLLVGQLGAVLAANLLWFTSAQNRLPLVVPLAVASAAAVQTLRRLAAGSEAPRRWATAAVGCTLLTAQAFATRQAPSRPSSVHYYNLANVEESLGLNEAALGHYARASAQNPKQPMFWLRLAHLARGMRRPAEARRALDQLQALPNLPKPIARALEHERAALSAQAARSALSRDPKPQQP